MDVASRIYRHRGSHFQFNLLKARQKVIRYFTGAVDRGETAGSSDDGAAVNAIRTYGSVEIYASAYAALDPTPYPLRIPLYL